MGINITTSEKSNSQETQSSGKDISGRALKTFLVVLLTLVSVNEYASAKSTSEKKSKATERSLKYFQPYIDEMTELAAQMQKFEDDTSMIDLPPAVEAYHEIIDELRLTSVRKEITNLNRDGEINYPQIIGGKVGILRGSFARVSRCHIVTAAHNLVELPEGKNLSTLESEAAQIISDGKDSLKLKFFNEDLTTISASGSEVVAHEFEKYSNPRTFWANDIGLIKVPALVSVPGQPYQVAAQTFGGEIENLRCVGKPYYRDLIMLDYIETRLKEKGLKEKDKPALTKNEKKNLIRGHLWEQEKARIVLNKHKPGTYISALTAGPGMSGGGCYLESNMARDFYLAAIVVGVRENPTGEVRLFNDSLSENYIDVGDAILTQTANLTPTLIRNGLISPNSKDWSELDKSCSR